MSDEVTTTVCITGDIDDGKLEDKKCLDSYFAILNRYKIKMTIPVTAEAVENYPERMRYILKCGHEITGHGDVHKAFYEDIHDQIKRLQIMIDIIYEILGVKIKGFRAPWLQHNENTYAALSEVELMYDSSMIRNDLMFGSTTMRKRNINIEGQRATLIGKIPFGGKTALDAYKIARSKIVELKSFKKVLVHPFLLNDDVVELPITNPDDWYLISNPKGPLYKHEESEEIGKIWLEILRLMRRNKNLLVIQAHPGRMSPEYLSGLEYFLNNAKNYNLLFKRLDEAAHDFVVNKIESMDRVEV